MGTKVGLLLAALVCGFAQDGQRSSQPGWPCVAGRAVDPGYLEVSESTGGQLFLFQPGEMVHSVIVMNAPTSHPLTLIRAVGQVQGERRFEFPVDSSIDSLLVMASVQCRQSVAIHEPGGSEVVAERAAQNVNLLSGRIVRIDNPSYGNWSLRLSGQGLFVFTVLVKSGLGLTGVRDGMAATAKLPSEPRFFAVDPMGQVTAEVPHRYDAESGRFRLGSLPAAGRYRIAMTARDTLGWPVLRTHPVLFKAAPPQSASAHEQSTPR